MADGAGWKKPATQRFAIGDRVTLTKTGLQRITSPTPYGTVVGFNASAFFSVRVRPDRRKTSSSYWVGFWRRVRKGEVKRG